LEPDETNFPSSGLIQAPCPRSVREISNLWLNFLKASPGVRWALNIQIHGDFNKRFMAHIHWSILNFYTTIFVTALIWYIHHLSFSCWLETEVSSSETDHVPKKNQCDEYTRIWWGKICTEPYSSPLNTLLKFQIRASCRSQSGLYCP
jgi:hypothetical protein